DCAIFVQAKPEPFVARPLLVPTKNDEGGESPPFARPLDTVTAAVPTLATSEAVKVICIWFAEMKFVPRVLPLMLAVEDEMKFAPVMMTVAAAPPAATALGINAEMIGVCGPGVGGEGGRVPLGGGRKVACLLEMKEPPTMNSCPPEVVKASPFCPQRTILTTFPLTPGMLMESTSV